MDINFNLKKGCLYIFICYVLTVFLFYFIGGEQLQLKNRVYSSDVSPNSVVGELVKGKVLEQQFKIQEDTLTGIDIFMATYSTPKTGTLSLRVLDSNKLLVEKNIDVAQIVDNEYLYVGFEKIDDVKDKLLTLQIESLDGTPGNAVTVWMGNTISTGKFDANKNFADYEYVNFNGEQYNSILCFSVYTQSKLLFGQFYWEITLICAVLLGVYLIYLCFCNEKNRNSYSLKTISILFNYRFLMKQLVERDFKTKYKRSTLGILWSFLNPLLTMLVQYLVFSTLFKSDIENFVIYLLAGIVCFSFFNEATNLGLTSITGNASLITKVYVPKFIYPLTRTVSSAINFAISLVPILLAMILTKTSITFSILLLPFGMFCLFMFCFGMCLLLSSMMVFFRDTQFLWNVLSMLWMYSTPIFYPETILPSNLLFLFKLNPLYHIIRFFRVILINGLSPEPQAYLYCFIASFIPFVIGMVIFRKTQNRFMLYI